MSFRIALVGPGRRVVFLAVLGTGCGLLLQLAVSNLVLGALSDDRIGVSTEAAPGSFVTAPLASDRMIHPDDLLAALANFPDSPRLQARVAGFKFWSLEGDMTASEPHARRAVELSPHDYRGWLLLASIQETLNELEAAEASARRALDLGPLYLESHWLLATVLLRTGRIAESLPEFRVAAGGDESYLRAALDWVWDASSGDVEAVRGLTPEDAASRLVLAQFLFDHGRPEASAAEFRGIDAPARLAAPESVHYLDSLIEGGEPDLARELWTELVGTEGHAKRHDLMWNGDFESDILVDFAHFDWSVRPTRYARVSIDPHGGVSGSRSLRLDFAGLETTRLTDEIHQRTRVKPGKPYRLEFRVRTEAFTTPSPLRVVISSPAPPKWQAASEPMPTGSSEWELRTVDFTAPSADLRLGIGLEPRYSYEEPTEGSIWFDEFRLTELPETTTPVAASDSDRAMHDCCVTE